MNNNIFKNLENEIKKIILISHKYKTYKNLNVSNLGFNKFSIISNVLEKVINEPFEMYRLRDLSIKKIINLLKIKYPNSKNYDVSISYGSTMISNLIGYSLRLKKKKLKIITTNHEHSGGFDAFNKNFFYYKVNFDEKDILEAVKKKKPHVVFFSHVSYIDGKKLDIYYLYKEIKKINKDTIIILDIAQSFAINDNPFGYADILFCSLHKYICGPYGYGLVWVKNKYVKIFDTLGGDKAPPNGCLGIRGGDNFISLLNIYVSLKIFFKNINKVPNLKKILDIFLSKNFKLINNKNNFISCITSDKSLEKLYLKLRTKKISVKFFKDKNIIRITIPFFYLKNDILNIINVIKVTI